MNKEFWFEWYLGNYEDDIAYWIDSNLDEEKLYNDLEIKEILEEYYE